MREPGTREIVLRSAAGGAVEVVEGEVAARARLRGSALEPGPQLPAMPSDLWPHAGMEYGSSRYRLAATSPAIVATGRYIVAASSEQFADRRLQATAIDDGKVWSAAPVNVFAVPAGRVLAAPVDASDRLRVHTVPALDVVVEVGFGSEIVALAGTSELVAAALADGAVVLATVAQLADGARRRVEVATPTIIAFSPDARWLAVGTQGGRIAIIDVERGAVARTLTGGKTAVASLHWSSHGAWLAAGCGKTAYAWPAAGGKPTTLGKAKAWATVIGVHGSAAIVHALRETVRGVDLATGNEVWRVPPYGPAILRGDRAIAVRFGDISEVDARTGARGRTITAPNINVAGVEVVADTVVLAMSSGTRLAVGDSATQRWTPTSEGHGGAVLAVDFDGERFATGARDNRAMVWTRGRPDPVATVAALSAGGGAYPVGGVCLAGEYLWTGQGTAVHRFPDLRRREPVARRGEVRCDVARLARRYRGRLHRDPPAQPRRASVARCDHARDPAGGAARGHVTPRDGRRQARGPARHALVLRARRRCTAARAAGPRTVQRL